MLGWVMFSISTCTIESRSRVRILPPRESKATITIKSWKTTQPIPKKPHNNKYRKEKARTQCKAFTYSSLAASSWPLSPPSVGIILMSSWFTCRAFSRISGNKGNKKDRIKKQNRETKDLEGDFRTMMIANRTASFILYYLKVISLFRVFICCSFLVIRIKRTWKSQILPSSRPLYDCKTYFFTLLLFLDSLSSERQGRTATSRPDVKGSILAPASRTNCFTQRTAVNWTSSSDGIGREKNTHNRQKVRYRERKMNACANCKVLSIRCKYDAGRTGRLRVANEDVDHGRVVHRLRPAHDAVQEFPQDRFTTSKERTSTWIIC